jgi:hypothetical protein
MTDNSQTSGRSRLGGAFWLVQGLVILALVILAYLVGRSCAARGQPQRPVIVDDEKARAAAEQHLVAAEQKKTWNQADETEFRGELVGLSFKTRFAFQRRLAHLINSQGVAVDLVSNPPDIAICPCTPGLCAGATPTSPTPTAPPAGASPARR